MTSDLIWASSETLGVSVAETPFFGAYRTYEEIPGAWYAYLLGHMRSLRIGEYYTSEVEARAACDADFRSRLQDFTEGEIAAAPRCASRRWRMRFKKSLDASKPRGQKGSPLVWANFLRETLAMTTDTARKLVEDILADHDPLAGRGYLRRADAIDASRGGPNEHLRLVACLMPDALLTEAIRTCLDEIDRRRTEAENARRVELGIPPR